MAADEKWYFTKEQLQNTPSRKCGFDADKELSYRQQAANFIQDMGQKLQVSQLCINTAIVYMHRFYMFHSFTHFPWNTIAAASFFLAAKVEEQPRKLEHVIRVANHCLHREQSATFDAKSEQYAAQSQDLVFNENVLLQTLGFDVAIDHPHTHVVRCCHLVRASKDLAQTSYFMASNSLHLTTMCLQYKPTVVACFCIHLACKWSNWQIPKSNEGKDWFYYVDKSVTSELLEQLTAEFLKIFDKCPSRLKRKISSISTINQNHSSQGGHIMDPTQPSSSNSPFDPDSRKMHNYDNKDSGPTFHPRSHHEPKPALLATPEEPHRKPQRPHDAASSQPHQQRPDYREYREKKERERLEREKVQHHSKPVVPVPGGKHMPPNSVLPVKAAHGAHHRPPVNIDPNKMKIHHRPNEVTRDSLGREMSRGEAVSVGHSREHPGKEPLGRDITNGRDVHRDREHPVNNREVHSTGRDVLNKDIQKREYLLPRPDVKLDSESSVKVESAGDCRNVTDKQRYEQTRPKIDPKLQMKHDPNRHRRELDPKYQKRPEVQPPQSNVPADINKKPVAVPSAQDKPNNFLEKQNNFVSKQVNSISARHKSPFPDAPKSVPVPTNVSVHPPTKTDIRNGNHSAMPVPTDDRNVKPWQPENQQSVESDLLSPPIKKASLFSPEKTPPHKKSWSVKTPPNVVRKVIDASQLPVLQNAIPPAISPFGSPPPKIPSSSLKRPRTSSSGSEPELRPVVQKLDQISGFENIIRDSKMGIKLPKVPDIIQPICDRTSELSAEPSISKELKPPDIIKPFSTSSDLIPLSQPLVNGIETDPAMISNLLKEAAPPLNHLPPVAEITKSPEPVHTINPPSGLVIQPAASTVVIDSEKHKGEHHHKSEKKKKKDKHKHKDKDKNKDEKKKKHKDKDKERHKVKPEKTEPEGEVPLKITIPKDKIQQPVEATTSSSGLKVKISKDRLISDPVPPSSLKIKISKDQIQYNSVVDSSRKREREKISPPILPPPAKTVKTTYHRNQDMSRQNGRNSYNKVAQLGDGEASQLRLAESKYHSKGASKAS